jgi:hypothetical protein
MRTGVLSDESVRRFCKTIERDESTAPLTDRLLATRGNRQQFARRLAEASYTPEQLAVLSPRMYAAMFQRAAHVLTAAEGEEWEGYDEFEESEGEGEESYEDAAAFLFEPLQPAAAGSSTDPMTPPSSSRRRSYSMASTFSTTEEPVPAPIEKRLDFSDPRDKRDISRPLGPPTPAAASRSTKARAMLTRSRMKNLTREQLVEMYEDAYWQAKNRPPPPLDAVATRQIGEDLLALV